MDGTPLHETKIHGSLAFPYSVYHGRIPEWIRSFPLHWHDHFELIYCAGGHLRVTLWGQGYRLCAEDLIVILPHAVHAIEQDGEEAGEYFNIMFHPSIFCGSEDDRCYEKYVLPFVEGGRTIECFHRPDSAFSRMVMPCILSLLAFRRDSYATHELAIKSGLFLLLHYMNQCGTAADGNPGGLRLSYGRLKEALYYVQNCYDREVSVREAAGRCGFSESHFMKLFREFTGRSFNAYVVDYRLELAAKQLSETDLRVIDVAENCGFRNHSYFTRAFQKKYRKTPMAYRKALR